jgi:L-lysine 2,3-aminomutase
MITRTVPAWHQSLINAFREPDELARYLEIDPELFPVGSGGDCGFSMLVPMGFARRMEKGNPHDPLLLQVMPGLEESQTAPDFGPDPVGDGAATVEPGVLHKYHGRILLITTGACSIHCRYCFRRHFPYSDSNTYGPNLQRAVEYIEAHPEVEEVILSGGDPLMLSDEALGELIAGLEQIEWLKRLRIHSRIPITLPERVTPELAGILGDSRLQTIVVVHSNHANELDQTVSLAARELTQQGITLLNQSVLLRHINDSSEALCQLNTRLFSMGILPYYLHLLDRVQGAMHFEVGPGEAASIHAGLLEQLPGYLVPRLVYEKAGAKSKLALSL